MITVTNNGVQQINAAILALGRDSDDKVRLLNQKLKEANDAIASINKILDGLNKDANVISVNGKTGIVTLDASDVGALPDSTVIPDAQVNSDWNATSGVAEILNKPNLASVATSGSYNDLSDKPTIPAAQVNSDWNATSGVAQILNKPNLSTVATSGSYNDLSNKPTIPTATSQLTNDSDFATNSALNSVTAIGLKETYHFTRTNIAPQTWTDIITPSDIPQSGIYVFNLSINDNAFWWAENATFLTYFFATGTNSTGSTPIYFNQEGHAPNGLTIQLRFQRTVRNTLQQSIQIYFSNCNQSTMKLKVSAYRVA